MFAGALTPAGFVDFFDHIMPVQKARARYFLKGASGGGKGTFMRRVAEALAKRGIAAIELFHCANDAPSLDAIAAPQIGLCIMDATAPHSRDPQIPAITDIIIDFAQFLDKDKLSGHKRAIQNLLHDKKVIMDKAMGYFAAAGKVYSADKAAAHAALNSAELEYLADTILCRGDLWSPAPNAKALQHSSEACRGELCSPASNRKLFLTAVTPEGQVSLADDAFDDCYVYALHTEEQIGTNRLLTRIQQAVSIGGIATESFHNPLAPSQIEYLHLPSQKQAFVTTGGIFGYRGKVNERIDLAPCINPAMLIRIKLDIERDTELLNSLLDQTTSLLRAAKALHTKIEEIYIQAMDFARADEVTQKFITSIDIHPYS
jgi:hypothetical protein